METLYIVFIIFTTTLIIYYYCCCWRFAAVILFLVCFIYFYILLFVLKFTRRSVPPSHSILTRSLWPNAIKFCCKNSLRLEKILYTTHNFSFHFIIFIPFCICLVLFFFLFLFNKSLIGMKYIHRLYGIKCGCVYFFCWWCESSSTIHPADQTIRICVRYGCFLGTFLTLSLVLYIF